MTPSAAAYEAAFGPQITTAALDEKQHSCFAGKAAVFTGYCVAMSEENVEIVLAAVDAWNRGDREAWLALWDEEAEFYPLRAQLEGKSYWGHDGMERFLAEMTEEWDEVRFEMEETRDAGEQVVSIGRFRARGRASGVDINVPLGVFTRVRRGKIVYTRFFSEPADALEAAGPSE